MKSKLQLFWYYRELKFDFHFIECYNTEPFEDTLANFIFRYRLPYIAQVLEGIDSPTGACSLSLNEILTIHTVVRLKRIKMRNSKGKYFYLPVDNAARVEIVPKTRTRLSNGLRSHTRRPAKFLRTLKEMPELILKEGDILDPILNETTRQEREANSYSGPETLKCKVLSQPGKEIRLALDYVGPFESFEDFDPRRYSLRYVADNIALPVAVRFIGDVEYYPDVRTSLKGEFRFEEVVEDSIVIATTKLQHDQFTILKLPVDLQVTLFPIRKLRCNAGYLSQYWECIQREIDKLEKQITSVEEDLWPESFFQEAMLPVPLEGNGNIEDYVAKITTRKIDECMPVLDGDSDVYEAMGSFRSGRPEECGLEGTEDYYEAMEPSMGHNLGECIPTPEGAEDHYEAMVPPIFNEYVPVQANAEPVYEAMEPSIAYRPGEGLPYSRARSRQRMSRKNNQDYKEKPLYSSLVSFQPNSSSMEISPNVYAKLQRKST
ncbi:uncharacterized protein LOC144649421 [Oculina patagonica]